MAVSVQWLLRGKVLYSRFLGNVEYEDVQEIGEKQIACFADYPHASSFQLIMDGSLAKEYPRSPMLIRQYIDARAFERVDWFVIVTQDYFQQHIAQIFSHLFRTRFHASPTLLEAYRFLQARGAVSLLQSWPENINDTMPQR